MMKRPHLLYRNGFSVIGASISVGGLKKGPDLGPLALLKSDPQWLKELRDLGISATWTHSKVADETSFWQRPRCEDDFRQSLPIVAEFARHLSSTVMKTVMNDQFPIVLGGDHSIAIGTWSGVAQGLNWHKPKSNLGLIWIDAHMDSHTPQTSPSQAIHGMPLAVLLGHGDPSLTHIGGSQPKISPQNLVLMGVRSYEVGEEAFLASQGVRVMLMSEIQERGFQACFREAIAVVTRDTAGFGLSIDLDAFDPIEAPGVTTPCSLGLRASEVIPVLQQIVGHPLLAGLEFAEFCPPLDSAQGSTFVLLKNLLSVFMTPRGLSAKVNIAS